MQTTIRCGKLQENGKEDQEKVLILHRTHNSVSKKESKALIIINRDSN